MIVKCKRCGRPVTINDETLAVMRKQLNERLALEGIQKGEEKVEVVCGICNQPSYIG